MNPHTQSETSRTSPQGSGVDPKERRETEGSQRVISGAGSQPSNFPVPLGVAAGVLASRGGWGSGQPLPLLHRG